MTYAISPTLRAVLEEIEEGEQRAVAVFHLSYEGDRGPYSCDCDLATDHDGPSVRSADD